MSLKTLEKEIWEELKKVEGNPKIKLKDIAEWCTTDIQPQDGEKLVFLPSLKIYVCYTTKTP